MITQVTADIKISVESIYQPEYSNPENQHYMFAYRITIENQGAHTMQILRRHWLIFDSIGERKEVDADGVVGEQPIIGPGESHQYVSGCNLKSEFGYMQGHYEVHRQVDSSVLEVVIPRFHLIAQYRLN